ncbi:hypothetical protein ACFLXD_04980 [Chloroflexota bacterium]
MWKRITSFLSRLKEKRIHPLFPLLTSCVGIWVGNVLDNPFITASTLVISIYLALVIFVPWEKVLTRIHKYRTLMPHLISLLVCLVLVIFFWNGGFHLLSDDPFDQQINTAIAHVDVIVKADEKEEFHSHNTLMLDGDGYIALFTEQGVILDCKGYGTTVRPFETNNRYIIDLKMEETSDYTQNKIKHLRLVKHAQIRMYGISDNATVLGGEVAIILNGFARFELNIPSQMMRSKDLFIPDFQEQILNIWR